MERFVLKNKQRIDKIEENLDILGKEVSKDIFTAVKKVVQQYNKGNDPVSITALEDIKRVLSEKADN